MFYYLYEIKNKVNGKIYVGVHQTPDLDDGYMGSGRSLAYAFKKHGFPAFEKTILEHFADKTSMFSREKEVVTNEFINRPDVYNQRPGGIGGSAQGKVVTNEHKAKISAGIRSALATGKMDEALRKAKERMLLDNPAKKIKNRIAQSIKMSGVAKSEEHRKNISAACLGKKKTYAKRNRKPLSEETKKKISDSMKKSKTDL